MMKYHVTEIPSREKMIFYNFVLEKMYLVIIKLAYKFTMLKFKLFSVLI